MLLSDGGKPCLAIRFACVFHSDGKMPGALFQVFVFMWRDAQALVDLTCCRRTRQMIGCAG